MVSRGWQEILKGSDKNKKKSHFTPLPGRPCGADFFTPFGIWCHIANVINPVKSAY